MRLSFDRLPRLPIARWLPELREPGALRADALAGLTGAVVVLPQGVAFATLAGMPPEYGLYTAMVPCVIAALFGSSRLMITGPANAISLSTMALMAPIAIAGSPHYVALVLTLTFLVGALQLALGLARAGRLIDFVPHSVIVGFTAGAAILIINSQIGPFLGLDLPPGSSVFDNVRVALEQLPNVKPSAPLVGLLTIFAVLAWRPLNRWVPAMLAGVVIGAAAAWLLAQQIPQWGVLPTVQELPGALPPISLPDLSVDTLRTLFGATMVMTLLALTEAVAIARAVAVKYGDKLDGNQEFIGQGLANLAGAFFSAYPSSGSFNRSGVNVASGARTPFAAICAALFLLVVLFFVAPLARYLPFAVIAALLFLVAWGLIDRREIARIWNEERTQRWPMMVTFIATITLSLEWAILLGITVALITQRFNRS
ncbi:MAG: SulP family inorganic anion transporter [Burkholderiaceae bacterium]|nr:SulP family inorganic anion transporter [Burkholderiaceae bacterium]